MENHTEPENTLTYTQNWLRKCCFIQRLWSFWVFIPNLHPHLGSLSWSVSLCGHESRRSHSHGGPARCRSGRRWRPARPSRGLRLGLGCEFKDVGPNTPEHPKTPPTAICNPAVFASKPCRPLQSRVQDDAAHTAQSLSGQELDLARGRTKLLGP